MQKNPDWRTESTIFCNILKTIPIKSESRAAVTALSLDREEHVIFRPLQYVGLGQCMTRVPITVECWNEYCMQYVMYAVSIFTFIRTIVTGNKYDNSTSSFYQDRVHPATAELKNLENICRMNMMVPISHVSIAYLCDLFCKYSKYCSQLNILEFRRKFLPQ